MHMPRKFKSRAKKIGLPPGSLIHIGERCAVETKITLLDYDESQFQEREIKTVAECQPFKDRNTVTWLHINCIHDIKILEELGDVFALHPLTLEDILNTDQRPKMEDFGEYIYIVLKNFYKPNDQSYEIISEQISIILGSGFIISLQEKETDLFKPIRERIKTVKGRLRKSGADYLVHALMDTIVDHYFVILEKLGEQIELTEESLIRNPSTETLRTIQNLKREMLFLRKTVWPLRETVNSFERSESPLIHKSTGIYLKDIYDHTIQVIDTIETYRDMLSGMLDIYLSSISNRLNEVMKVLTVIATIFMPLTFLAGVYGMNFKYMPELEWHWGYFTVWAIMITIAVLMLFFFKRRKWL